MSIQVNIASEFTGKKAFKQAETASAKLEKQVGKLGKQLASLFAAQKVIAFGKASVKAFAEEEKSAAALANTMKNLGIAFATPNLENFISELSQAAGVADDILRPSIQKLLTQTGNYAKSQELLTQAIDISRGAGVSLETVVQDLASAYVGNVRGLRKYNLGLTQAELTASSFTDIQKKLTQQFSGASAAYLNTYAGKMEVLATAAGEAQETIGKGLVDSLIALGGDTSVKDLADNMQSFADYTSNAIFGIATLAGKLQGLKSAAPTWLQSLLSSFGESTAIATALQGINKLSNYGNVQRNKTLPNASVQMFMTDQANQRANNVIIKKQQDAAKKIIDAQKKLTAEQKKQADLKKAGSIFDLKQVELIAALKGNISDEERKRLELQLALEQGNVTEAKALTYQLAIAQGLGVKIAQDLASLPQASNPFAAWKGYLDAIELQALRIASFGGGSPSPAPSGNVPKMPIASPDLVLAEANAGFAAANNQIKIIVEGGDEVTSLMRFKIQEAAQSGATTNWSQTVGAWDR